MRGFGIVRIWVSLIYSHPFRWWVCGLLIRSLFSIPHAFLRFSLSCICNWAYICHYKWHVGNNSESCDLVLLCLDSCICFSTQSHKKVYLIPLSFSAKQYLKDATQDELNLNLWSKCSMTLHAHNFPIYNAVKIFIWSSISFAFNLIKCSLSFLYIKNQVCLRLQMLS